MYIFWSFNTHNHSTHAGLISLLRDLSRCKHASRTLHAHTAVYYLRNAQVTLKRIERKVIVITPLLYSVNFFFKAFFCKFLGAL